MEELTLVEKKNKNRKDLIKNILIAFLAIMLLLTFFSGTIQNWSLPEVATTRIESATISPRLRGSGTVEADDPYNVVLGESRKVASVSVKAGDEVKKGDTIYVLEDRESTELEEALSTLKKLENEYELALFAGDVTDASVARVRSGNTGSVDSYQMEMKNINDRFLAATEADKGVDALLAALEQEHERNLAAISGDTSAQAYMTATAEAEITKLNNSRTPLAAEVAAQQAVMDANMVEDPVDSGIMRVPENTEEPKYTAYNEAKTARDKAQQELNDIDAEIASYQNVVADNTRDASYITTQKEQLTNAENLRYAEEKAKLDAQKLQTAAALETVTKEKDEFYGNVKAEINLSFQQEQIAEAREKVNKLREKSTGTVVTSPVDGIVSSLTYVAGQTIEANETAAVIQVAGKAMAMSFSVTNNQAKNLKTGDEAEPQNSWQYSQFRATLQSIKPDPDDPGNKKKLTFAIDSPEVQAGQTVAIMLGEASRSYDMTVPNPAIREDNNGKFILIVQEKSSPLRNRYIAQRVDVDVVTSDDTTSAITAALEGWEYVITTANAPIKAGQQVRLANTQ